MTAVVPSCSSWSTSTWTSARLLSVRPMLSTVPAGEPPISTWFSGTSCPAFWKTKVYLWPPPPLRRTTARMITAAARATIAAMRAGEVPRPVAGRFSSPTVFAATDRRLLSSSPAPPTRQNDCKIVSEAFLGKPPLSRDLTRIQRPPLQSWRLRVATLDAEFGNRPRQRLRQPPDAVAEQEHERGQEDDADDRGVDEDGDREPDAELADVGDRRAGEGDEDRHHDRRRAGDDPGRALEPEIDRGGIVAVTVVVLAHAAEEEDRVIDREAEDEAEDHRRAHRVHVFVAPQRPVRGQVEEEREDAEGDPDRGQVQRHCDRRQQQRPQHHHQDQEGGEGDRQHDPGDARAGDAAVVVELSGAAGDAGREAGFFAQFGGGPVELLVEPDRAGRVEAVVGDHPDRRRLPALAQVDRFADRFALLRRRPVEGGEDEVAGVEEARRRAGDAGGLPADPALPRQDLHARFFQPAFQRRAFANPVQEPVGERFGDAPAAGDPAAQRRGAAGEAREPVPEPPRLPGQAGRSAGELFAAALELPQPF